MQLDHLAMLHDRQHKSELNAEVLGRRGFRADVAHTASLCCLYILVAAKAEMLTCVRELLQSMTTT
jgi:hypothetical protein